MDGAGRRLGIAAAARPAKRAFLEWRNAKGRTCRQLHKKAKSHALWPPAGMCLERAGTLPVNSAGGVVTVARCSLTTAQ